MTFKIIKTSRICPYCQKEFKPKYDGNRFCSRECKNKMDDLDKIIDSTIYNPFYDKTTPQKEEFDI